MEKVPDNNLIYPKVELNDEPEANLVHVLDLQMDSNKENTFGDRVIVTKKNTKKKGKGKKRGRTQNSLLPNLLDITFDPANYKPLDEFIKYEYGLNAAGKENERLFIFESPDLVRVYVKLNNSWYCHDCYETIHSQKNYCKNVNNILYIPLQHTCYPDPYCLIQDWQDSIKIQIVNSKRYIKFTKYEYGKNAAGKENSRLIVQDENNKDLVFQYCLTQHTTWTCLNPKCNFQAYIIEENVYVHCNHFCKPETSQEVMDKQKAIRKKPPKVVVNAPVLKKRKFIESSEDTGNGNVDFVEGGGEHNEREEQPENIFGEEIVEPDDNMTKPTPAQLSTSISFNLLPIDNQNDDVGGDELRGFKYPSTTQLKAICEKLNIPFSQQAYNLWNNMKIRSFGSNCKPSETFSNEAIDDSGFKCFSLLFAGNIDHTTAIQRALNQYFFEYFQDLGTLNGTNFTDVRPNDPLIKQTIFSPYITPIHYHLVARWLSCDLRVYENNEWKTFGEETKDGPTILLAKNDNSFRVVMSVDNN